MRYIAADERSIGLADIRKGFAEAGTEYEVDGEEPEATISYQGKPIGHVTSMCPATACSKRSETS